jgi:hypothetical protein
LRVQTRLVHLYFDSSGMCCKLVLFIYILIALACAANPSSSFIF